jgi:hypothetical protein
MVKRDRTGEPVEAENEEPNYGLREPQETENGGEQDTLVEMGQGDIKDIGKLKKKYLKILTKELYPSKNEKDQKEIKNHLVLWRYIDAYFAANEVAREKNVAVEFQASFAKYSAQASLKFKESAKTSTLFGELSSDAKFSQELYSEYGKRW